jgi:hypothetical protein
MDKIENKKSLLDQVRLSEGIEFECDENAILAEYDIQEENKASLAIKILSIFGGFLASLTFLGFIGIGGLFNSGGALSILGFIFVFAAILLNKAYDKLITDTFSISIYVIGFALILFGLLELNFDKNIGLLLIISIAFGSLFITQNYIFSFISVLTISGNLLALILLNNNANLIHVYIAIVAVLISYLFLNEAKIIASYKKLSKLYFPVRIGLIFSLLAGLIIVGKRSFIYMSIEQNYIWISSIVLFIVVFYIVKNIITINEITDSKKKITIYSLTALVLIPTLFSPSISGAIVIILLSFLVNYRTGLAIGVLSIIYFISQYYYDLNFTLLTKSILLFSSGIVFILCYLFISKNSINEKI